MNQIYLEERKPKNKKQYAFIIMEEIKLLNKKKIKIDIDFFLL